MDDSLKVAVDLFNEGRYSEFQDRLEAMTSQTRAISERGFYTLLDNFAEALLQLSDGDIGDAVEMIQGALRKLDEYMPRFRGLNIQALRDEFRQVLVELRENQAGTKIELAPSRIPRLRILPE
jgi:hypothetical protein